MDGDVDVKTHLLHIKSWREVLDWDIEEFGLGYRGEGT
jgi:hypothetical protein